MNKSGVPQQEAPAFDPNPFINIFPNVKVRSAPDAEEVDVSDDQKRAWVTELHALGLLSPADVLQGTRDILTALDGLTPARITGLLQLTAARPKEEQSSFFTDFALGSLDQFDHIYPVLNVLHGLRTQIQPEENYQALCQAAVLTELPSSCYNAPALLLLSKINVKFLFPVTVRRITSFISDATPFDEDYIAIIQRAIAECKPNMKERANQQALDEKLNIDFPVAYALTKNFKLLGISLLELDPKNVMSDYIKTFRALLADNPWFKTESKHVFDKFRLAHLKEVITDPYVLIELFKLEPGFANHEPFIGALRSIPADANYNDKRSAILDAIQFRQKEQQAAQPPHAPSKVLSGSPMRSTSPSLTPLVPPSASPLKAPAAADSTTNGHGKGDLHSDASDSGSAHADADSPRPDSPKRSNVIDNLLVKIQGSISPDDSKTPLNKAYVDGLLNRRPETLSKVVEIARQAKNEGAAASQPKAIELTLEQIIHRTWYLLNGHEDNQCALSFKRFLDFESEVARLSAEDEVGGYEAPLVTLADNAELTIDTDTQNLVGVINTETTFEFYDKAALLGWLARSPISPSSRKAINSATDLHPIDETNFDFQFANFYLNLLRLNARQALLPKEFLQEEVLVALARLPAAALASEKLLSSAINLLPNVVITVPALRSTVRSLPNFLSLLVQDSSPDAALVEVFVNELTLAELLQLHMSGASQAVTEKAQAGIKAFCDKLEFGDAVLPEQVAYVKYKINLLLSTQAAQILTLKPQWLEAKGLALLSCLKSDLVAKGNITWLNTLDISQWEVIDFLAINIIAASPQCGEFKEFDRLPSQGRGELASVAAKKGFHSPGGLALYAILVAAQQLPQADAYLSDKTKGLLEHPAIITSIDAKWITPKRFAWLAGLAPNLLTQGNIAWLIHTDITGEELDLLAAINKLGTQTFDLSLFTEHFMRHFSVAGFELIGKFDLTNINSVHVDWLVKNFSLESFVSRRPESDPAQKLDLAFAYRTLNGHRDITWDEICQSSHITSLYQRNIEQLQARSGSEKQPTPSVQKLLGALRANHPIPLFLLLEDHLGCLAECDPNDIDSESLKDGFKLIEKLPLAALSTLLERFRTSSLQPVQAAYQQLQVKLVTSAREKSRTLVAWFSQMSKENPTLVAKFLVFLAECLAPSDWVILHNCKADFTDVAAREKIEEKFQKLFQSFVSDNIKGQSSNALVYKQDLTTNLLPTLITTLQNYRRDLKVQLQAIVTHYKLKQDAATRKYKNTNKFVGKLDQTSLDFLNRILEALENPAVSIMNIGAEITSDGLEKIDRTISSGITDFIQGVQSVLSTHAQKLQKYCSDADLLVETLHNAAFCFEISQTELLRSLLAKHPEIVGNYFELFRPQDLAKECNFPVPTPMKSVKRNFLDLIQETRTQRKALPSTTPGMPVSPGKISSSSERGGAATAIPVTPQSSRTAPSSPMAVPSAVASQSSAHVKLPSGNGSVPPSPSRVSSRRPQAPRALVVHDATRYKSLPDFVQEPGSVLADMDMNCGVSIARKKYTELLGSGAKATPEIAQFITKVNILPLLDTNSSGARYSLDLVREVATIAPRTLTIAPVNVRNNHYITLVVYFTANRKIQAIGFDSSFRKKAGEWTDYDREVLKFCWEALKEPGDSTPISQYTPYSSDFHYEPARLSQQRNAAECGPITLSNILDILRGLADATTPQVLNFDESGMQAYPIRLTHQGEYFDIPTYLKTGQEIRKYWDAVLEAETQFDVVDPLTPDAPPLRADYVYKASKKEVKADEARESILSVVRVAFVDRYESRITELFNLFQYPGDYDTTPEIQQAQQMLNSGTVVSEISPIKTVKDVFINALCAINSFSQTDENAKGYLATETQASFRRLLGQTLLDAVENFFKDVVQDQKARKQREAEMARELQEISALYSRGDGQSSVQTAPAVARTGIASLFEDDHAQHDVQLHTAPPVMQARRSSQTKTSRSPSRSPQRDASPTVRRLFSDTDEDALKPNSIKLAAPIAHPVQQDDGVVTAPAPASAPASASGGTVLLSSDVLEFMRTLQERVVTLETALQSKDKAIAELQATVQKLTEKTPEIVALEELNAHLMYVSSQTSMAAQQLSLEIAGWCTQFQRLGTRSFPWKFEDYEYLHLKLKVAEMLYRRVQEYSKLLSGRELEPQDNYTLGRVVLTGLCKFLGIAQAPVPEVHLSGTSILEFDFTYAIRQTIPPALNLLKEKVIIRATLMQRINLALEEYYQQTGSNKDSVDLPKSIASLQTWFASCSHILDQVNIDQKEYKKLKDIFIKQWYAMWEKKISYAQSANQSPVIQAFAFIGAFHQRTPDGTIWHFPELLTNTDVANARTFGNTSIFDLQPSDIYISSDKYVYSKRELLSRLKRSGDFVHPYLQPDRKKTFLAEFDLQQLLDSEVASTELTGVEAKPKLDPKATFVGVINFIRAFNRKYNSATSTKKLVLSELRNFQDNVYNIPVTNIFVTSDGYIYDMVTLAKLFCFGKISHPSTGANFAEDDMLNMFKERVFTDAISAEIDANLKERGISVPKPYTVTEMRQLSKAIQNPIFLKGIIPFPDSKGLTVAMLARAIGFSLTSLKSVLQQRSINQDDAHILSESEKDALKHAFHRWYFTDVPFAVETLKKERKFVIVDPKGPVVDMSADSMGELMIHPDKDLRETAIGMVNLVRSQKGELKTIRNFEPAEFAHVDPRNIIVLENDYWFDINMFVQPFLDGTPVIHPVTEQPLSEADWHKINNHPVVQTACREILNRNLPMSLAPEFRIFDVRRWPNIAEKPLVVRGIVFDVTQMISCIEKERRLCLPGTLEDLNPAEIDSLCLHPDAELATFVRVVRTLSSVYKADFAKLQNFSREVLCSIPNPDNSDGILVTSDGYVMSAQGTQLIHPKTFAPLSQQDLDALSARLGSGVIIIDSDKYEVEKLLRCWRDKQRLLLPETLQPVSPGVFRNLLEKSAAIRDFCADNFICANGEIIPVGLLIDQMQTHKKVPMNPKTGQKFVGVDVVAFYSHPRFQSIMQTIIINRDTPFMHRGFAEITPENIFLSSTNHIYDASEFAENIKKGGGLLNPYNDNKPFLPEDNAALRKYPCIQAALAERVTRLAAQRVLFSSATIDAVYALTKGLLNKSEAVIQADASRVAVLGRTAVEEFQRYLSTMDATERTNLLSFEFESTVFGANERCVLLKLGEILETLTKGVDSYHGAGWTLANFLSLFVNRIELDLEGANLGTWQQSLDAINSLPRPHANIWLGNAANVLAPV